METKVLIALVFSIFALVQAFSSRSPEPVSTHFGWIVRLFVENLFGRLDNLFISQASNHPASRSPTGYCILLFDTQSGNFQPK